MVRRVRALIERVAADLPAGSDGDPCLVLAPHPDDEVLGCGGTILRSIGEGRPVFIGFLTDGRRGVDARPDEARAVREQEALAAATALGVPLEHLTFFGVEDGALAGRVDEMAVKVRDLASRLGIREVYAPYRRDYHADHQAAWRIAHACRPVVRRIYEYPIWFGPWIWSRLGWKARIAATAHLADLRHAVKVDVRPVLAAKREALAAYTSQLAGFERLGPWGQELLAGFLSPFELFFVDDRP